MTIYSSTNDHPFHLEINIHFKNNSDTYTHEMESQLTDMSQVISSDLMEEIVQLAIIRTFINIETNLNIIHDCL